MNWAFVHINSTELLCRFLNAAEATKNRQKNKTKNTDFSIAGR